MNNNTHVVDLSKYFDINYTFNIEDLVDYKNFDFNSINPQDDKPSLELFSESLLLPSLPGIHSNTVKS